MGSHFSHLSGTGLPSARDAEQWQAECRHIDEQITALIRRRRGFEALIAAAQQLWDDFGALPAAMSPPLPVASDYAPVDVPRSPPPRPTPSLDQLRAEIVGYRPSALDQLGLGAERIRSAPPHRRAMLDDAARSQAQSLVERASIIRQRRQLFRITPQDPPAATEAPAPRPAEVTELAPPAAPGLGEAILGFLNRVSVGAPSAVIAAELRKTPALADIIDRSKTQLHTALSRLVDDGELVKGGGLYYRNRQKDPRLQAAE